MEYSTAVVIMAPPPIQAFATPLRLTHSFQGMMRVPAHITVLFPFVPLDQLDAACKILRKLMSDVAPFDVTLDGYGHFPTATYLKPADPAPIKALYYRIHTAFPNYPPYRGAFGVDDITPHMTVGEFQSEIERASADFPPYKPISFRVSNLHLVVGIEHEPVPWITNDMIPLGGK
jgi:2'-5' RNA ligase